MPGICVRCGGGKLNPSDLCTKCNMKWQKYMRNNPLKDYSGSRETREQSDKRWKAFIENREMRT